MTSHSGLVVLIISSSHSENDIYVINSWHILLGKSHDCTSLGILLLALLSTSSETLNNHFIIA